MQLTKIYILPKNARLTTLLEKAKHGYRPLSEQQQLEQILERLLALDQR
jgi:hypothetical protein